MEFLFHGDNRSLDGGVIELLTQYMREVPFHEVGRVAAVSYSKSGVWGGNSRSIVADGGRE